MAGVRWRWETITSSVSSGHPQTGSQGCRRCESSALFTRSTAFAMQEVFVDLHAARPTAKIAPSGRSAPSSIPLSLRPPVPPPLPPFRAAPGPSRTPSSASSRTTGTLFGHRKARIALAIQDTPQSPSPSLLLELAVPTGKFMQEMAADHLRVALECDKRNLPDISDGAAVGPSRLLDEPLWTAYVNGRKAGYAVRRDPTDGDLAVARLLRTVSAGAGVLPADVVGDGREGEGDLAYMRAHFDRVVGGKDSESFYMLNPDGNNGPELSIFFVRI
ncbi:protein MIZU-KUSSEI 1-like [Ananas comosus]|uniref:Protein MIZU-KUSSEI 1-like n=1 Tax=Ananas comosus TaxID=4615 RepID=A0A6P5G3G1_ANACO|nr:protein MIZU-KUSSEI 1-like [Ananas comosus]